MLSNQIRRLFIDYFVRNGHTEVPSSSLIPYGDKTILFTNAGMNQFKNVFLGLEQRHYTRAVTAQKVMRVSGKHNDLEEVGPSPRHHTFFEMLGNFSFGDYFKADAMKFALELVTQEYGLEMDRLWFTIFREDDEAEELWHKVGVSRSRILRFGEKDNFWQMGDTGPCGPNSELHYFTGARKEDNTADRVNSDKDQTTVEIWNLVFMQFNRDSSGKLTPLPRTGVDTGLGFERLVRILQGGESNYDTDLFLPIMDTIQRLAGHTDAQRREQYVPYRVIADHTRAASFLIADGVLPGNEGRNYVLRMIIRRALRFGRKLNFHEPFLYQVSQAVVDKMGDHYHELVERRDHILNTIHQEEERFARTLDMGIDKLNEAIAELSAKETSERGDHTVIPGEVAFKLYDTYGLPLEITRDEAKERGFTVDEAGFQAAREAARQRNRAAAQFEADYDLVEAYREAAETLKAEGKLPPAGVHHNPYGDLNIETRVVAILRDGEMTEHAVPGERVEIVLADTPFYVESGGQVSDTGMICAATEDEEQPEWCVAVRDVRRPAPGFITHVCEVEWGQPRIGARCMAQVDEARRWAIMRNHTATHLLHKSLRTVLGPHVEQQGSLVAPDRLRFDFSHQAALSEEELQQVSDLINDAVLRNYPVTAREEPYQEAIKRGAMALFSEKYGDIVRVVQVGNPDEAPFSVELCGGTHVDMTGDIGSAIIVGESALGAGVRRIEVVTGRGALEYTRRQIQQLTATAQALGAPPDRLAEHASKLAAQLAETQKALEKAQRELARARFNNILTNTYDVAGSAVLCARVESESADLLREMTDWFRERYASGVCVLGAVIAERPALVAAVTADLTKRGLDAGKLIREIARIVGGGGGGRPTLAQAGGKDADKLDEALAAAKPLIEHALHKQPA
ncbi:MAG: alanine--tRNA ligase [Anaerolineae bacterium]|nr:alanine--tRNA ligase [Thermoflexales bacterium]MDW8406641.1 alanine--tRNA ligase [Anaerolineae bacterium]